MHSWKQNNLYLYVILPTCRLYLRNSWMLIFSLVMDNLLWVRSSPKGENILSVSLLQIFGHPNKMLDWRANRHITLHTNIRVCPNILYSNASFKQYPRRVSDKLVLTITNPNMKSYYSSNVNNNIKDSKNYQTHNNNLKWIGFCPHGN